MRGLDAPFRSFCLPLTPFALALLLAGCGGGKAPPQMPPAEVGYVTLKAEPVTVSTELTGRITATLSSQVRPQVDGIIKARLFDEGSVVRAGQPLYQIDSRLYSASRDQTAAQLENAQATLATAKAKSARYAKLTDLDAVSRQDVDDAVAAARQAQANVHQYQAALRTADVNIGFTRVYAPISGRIGRSLFTPGALVTASQADPLTTIQQLDPIFVDITQSSQQLLKLRQSLATGTIMPSTAKVRLKLDDNTPYPQTGTIEFAEVTVDENAGTVTLRARFPNPQGLLLPGMFVRVETPQGVVPNGILAPQRGITRDAKGEATALIVDAAGKVEQRTVTAAQAIGTSWLITAGLKAGDRLIVEGTEKAKPGATVKAIPFVAARAGK